jgi:hypothetical protein
MQSPHRSYATQATLAGMSNQGDNEATLSALSTADLGYAGTLGSQAYLASTDSRGRLIQVDPRQDAQIRTQNSQRHAQRVRATFLMVKVIVTSPLPALFVVPAEVVFWAPGRNQ